MALVVHHINDDAAEAAKRSIRSIETAATLDKLQLALRDGDMAGRDLASGRSRDRADADRFDAARFQARLHLAALGPLTGDDAAQSERLSRLGPLINRKFALGLRGYEATTPGARDEIDSLIASMRDDEGRRLDALPRDAARGERELDVDHGRRARARQPAVAGVLGPAQDRVRRAPRAREPADRIGHHRRADRRREPQRLRPQARAGVGVPRSATAPRCRCWSSTSTD